MVEHLPQKTSPTSVIGMFPLGGAYARVRDEDTAFGGRRSARFMVTIDAACPTAELRGRPALGPDVLGSVGAVRGGCRQLRELHGRVRRRPLRAAYGADKYERLVLIKARYDPDNTFHLNANIAPAVLPV